MCSIRSGGGNCALNVKISFLGLEEDFFRPKRRPSTEFFLSIFFGVGLSRSSSSSSFFATVVSPASSLKMAASFLESLNDPPLVANFCAFLLILKL
jgi:hypothetical protein